MTGTDFFAGAEPVELAEMLDARERRVRTQRELLQKYRMPIICFTMNIPGQYKTYPLARQAFGEGRQAVESALRNRGIPIACTTGSAEKTGCQAFYCVDHPPERLKGLMMSLEEHHPLGRLFDLDVYDAGGEALHGKQHGRGERACFICGKPVWECSRSRAHSAETLSLFTARYLQDYFADQYAGRIGQLAVRALLYEVSVTPKPGLVDRCNSGSHDDMDFFTFVDSSCALIPYFRDITRASLLFRGEPEQLLDTLRPLGVLAEEAMLAQTGGVNTHKGLIYSLGILCAALGYLRQTGEELSPELVFDMCARIAAVAPAAAPDNPHQPQTNGQRVFEAHCISGIRGEVARGFPHVREHSLPVMEKLVQQGFSLNDAGAVALLHLIANVDDTNMIHRSNLDRARQIQAEMRSGLAEDRDMAGFIELAGLLDAEFIAEHLSPGGSADLLAVTFMMHFITVIV